MEADQTVADRVAGNPDIEVIQQYLRDRTVGCPACGYNLRGVAGGSCPECGTRLTLQLNSVDVPHKWWLIRLLSTALPLGFVGILAAAAGFGAWRSAYWGESDWWTLGALCGSTVVYSLMLIGIVRRRARFLARPRLEQRVRAIGLLLIMASLQVAMFYFFRRYVRTY